MKRLIVIALLLAVAAPGAAQQPRADAGGAPAAAHESKITYDLAKDYLTRAAEQMPESDYAFKPTPEVRSFAQLIGHVANANYALCSNALGERSPSAEDIEKARTTKAALVEALKASFAYCDRAYVQSRQDLAQPAQDFFTGAKTTRGGWLAFNAAHDFEHYGNIVTYLRLKGMVPPSSQPRGGN